MSFTEILNRLMAGQPLARAESHEAFGELMKGAWTPVQIAAFLTALRTKGETTEELAGAAEAMRAAAVPVALTSDVIVDTCGTGGDGQGCFNVSTAAAFVVAGAGFLVAKHGNRSISSRCGSADVLEAAGVTIQLDAPAAQRVAREAGIVFLFAPIFHPATKNAMPVRRELGVRTIFNLLGPLTNPARPNVQLIGVYEDRWVRPVAEVLGKLGCREGLVVHGQRADEIALTGPTHVAEIQAGEVREHEWRPEDFGVSSQPGEALQGGDAAHNVGILLSVLRGDRSPYREAVCLNAAAAIRCASRQRSQDRQQLSLKDAYHLAAESIQSGKALAAFEALKKASAAEVTAHG